MEPISNKTTKKICEEFYQGKIIDGVKNSNLEMILIHSTSWLFLMFAVLVLVLGLVILNTTLFYGVEKIIPITTMIVMISISICLFFKSSKTYIHNHKIVVENKLQKIKIIDLESHPRIYTNYTKTQNYDTHTERFYWSEQYDLHIEKNNVDIKLDMEQVGNKKINQLISNLKLRDKNEMSEQEWLESASDKEKTFSTCIDFLNQQEKIIGVKDKTKKMKIQNGLNYKKRISVGIVIMLISFFVGDSITKPIANEIHRNEVFDLFLFIAVIAFMYVFYQFTMMMDRGKQNYLNVSYPSDTTIKINKYLLDYKKNHVMLDIKKVQDLSTFEKYHYRLMICGTKNQYAIDLNLKKEKDIQILIDNLIFEPKTK